MFMLLDLYFSVNSDLYVTVCLFGHYIVWPSVYGFWLPFCVFRLFLQPHCGTYIQFSVLQDALGLIHWNGIKGSSLFSWWYEIQHVICSIVEQLLTCSNHKPFQRFWSHSRLFVEVVAHSLLVPILVIVCLYVYPSKIKNNTNCLIKVMEMRPVPTIKCTCQSINTFLIYWNRLTL